MTYAQFSELIGAYVLEKFQFRKYLLQVNSLFLS